MLNFTQKIECLDNAIHQLIKACPQFLEEESTGNDMLKGLFDIKTDILKQQYPIQDDMWPSRRWNQSKTDYIDLSGYSFDNLII